MSSGTDLLSWVQPSIVNVGSWNCVSQPIPLKACKLCNIKEFQSNTKNIYLASIS